MQYDSYPLRKNLRFAQPRISSRFWIYIFDFFKKGSKVSEVHSINTCNLVDQMTWNFAWKDILLIYLKINNIKQKFGLSIAELENVLHCSIYQT